MNEMFLLQLARMQPHSGIAKPGEPEQPTIKTEGGQFKQVGLLNIMLTGAQIQALMSVINQVAGEVQQAQQAAALKQVLQADGEAIEPSNGKAEPAGDE